MEKSIFFSLENFPGNSQAEIFCASDENIHKICVEMLLSASNFTEKIHLIESEVSQNKEQLFDGTKGQKFDRLKYILD